MNKSIIGWDEASGEDKTVCFTFWNGEYIERPAFDVESKQSHDLIYGTGETPETQAILDRPPIKAIATHAPIRQFSKIQPAPQPRRPHQMPQNQRNRDSAVDCASIAQRGTQ